MFVSATILELCFYRCCQYCLILNILSEGEEISRLTEGDNQPVNKIVLTFLSLFKAGTQRIWKYTNLLYGFVRKVGDTGL